MKREGIPNSNKNALISAVKKLSSFASKPILDPDMAWDACESFKTFLTRVGDPDLSRHFDFRSHGRSSSCCILGQHLQ